MFAKSPKGVLILCELPAEEILQPRKEALNRGPSFYLLASCVRVIYEHLYRPQWLPPINESHTQRKKNDAPLLIATFSNMHYDEHVHMHTAIKVHILIKAVFQIRCSHFNQHIVNMPDTCAFRAGSSVM